jgi:hypothetical protein
MAKSARATMAMLAIRSLQTSGMTPAQVIKALRPRELAYLCDVCDELRSLRICDDVFFEDDEDESEEEED